LIWVIGYLHISILTTTGADPEILERGGRQCISPVVAYRKCAFIREKTACWKIRQIKGEFATEPQHIVLSINWNGENKPNRRIT